VIVHNRGELPLFKNEGIDVATEADTNIAISKTKYSKYDPVSGFKVNNFVTFNYSSM
jgi:hypothetical protein